MAWGWSWWATTVGLVLGGMSLAAPLLLAKVPNLKNFVETITRFSVWIGIVVGIGGILGVLGWILSLGYIGRIPLFMIQWLLINLLALAVGLLLTMNLLRTRKEIPQEK